MSIEQLLTMRMVEQSFECNYLNDECINDRIIILPGDS